MNLSDAISRFRSIDEANIPAPKVTRKVASGSQFSPKSRFAKPGVKGGKKPAADPEPQRAHTRSGGPAWGQGADGREEIDVRYEQEQDRGVGIDHFTEDDDDVNWAMTEMMGLTEANVPAPAVARKNAGGKQFSPKSRFRKPYKGPKKKYNDDPANIPDDEEAMAAAERSTAGVSGPGYGKDGREEVDVRYEDVAPEAIQGESLEDFAKSLSYPKDLIQR